MYWLADVVDSGSPPALPVVVFDGHPPSMLWMTFHSEAFVAGESLVTPPCVAPPLNVTVRLEPIAKSVVTPPALLVDLQGKSEPEASNGLLFGDPYGGGFNKVKWPLTASV